MTDQDIERWTAEWRAGAPPVADLARTGAARAQAPHRRWIALDWIVGAGLLAIRRLDLACDRYGPTVMRFAAIGIGC